MKLMEDMMENDYTEKVPSDADAKSGMTFAIDTRHAKRRSYELFLTMASKEYIGESLNRYLLQNPLLTNNLTGVLLRFRQEPIAVTCDIEGMFHQVHVNPERCDLLRFLWWEESDLS